MRWKFFEKRERGRDGDRIFRFVFLFVCLFCFVCFMFDSVVFVVCGLWFDGDVCVGVCGVGGVRCSFYRRSRERGRGVVRRVEEWKCWWFLCVGVCIGIGYVYWYWRCVILRMECGSVWWKYFGFFVRIVAASRVGRVRVRCVRCVEYVDWCLNVWFVYCIYVCDGGVCIRWMWNCVCVLRGSVRFSRAVRFAIWRVLVDECVEFCEF